MLDSHPANACICLKGLSGIRAQIVRNKSGSFPLLRSIALYSQIGDWGTASNIPPLENCEPRIL